MTGQIQSELSAVTILAYLEQHADFLKQLSVTKLGLFGSFAKDQQTDHSDLDFIVDFQETSFKNYMTLLHFLEDSFGRSVDLGEEHLIREEIRDNILQDVRYVEGV